MTSFSTKTKLLWGLLSEEVRTGPFFVDIDLTSRCNLQCLGCPYHSPLSPAAARASKGDIPFDLVKGLFQELARMNAWTLVLQGEGEPLLYPHLMELVAIGKQAGFNLTLLTNGTLLGREIILGFIASRLDVLRVSLWATTPEQYANNYPGTNPEYFQRVVDGMRETTRLKDENGSRLPLLVLHYPINRNNYQSLDALVDLASQVGCDGVSFSPFYALEGRLNEYLLTRDEERFVMRTLKGLKRKASRLGLGHNIDETLLRYKIGAAVWEKTPCYISWYHARIRVDGKVEPCGRCTFSLGNLNEQTFSEIWHGPTIRNVRAHGMKMRSSNLLRERCDCDYCCFVKNNLHVHKIFRYFSPLRSR